MPAATRIERRWIKRALILATVSITAAAALLAMASPASAAIVATTTTLSLDNTSVALNQPVTMTATVTAANGTMPSGTVNFLSVATDGTTTTIGTATLVGSTAKLTTSSLAGGTYQLEAQYAGAFLSYGSSTSTPVQLSVAGVVLHNTSMTLSFDPSSFTAGDTATFTASVAETDGVQIPAGTVTFSSIVGGVESTLGQANLDGTGTATLSVGGWQPGSYTIIAEYTGDKFDRGASAQLSFTATASQVEAVTTTTTVSLDPHAIQTNGSVDISAQIVQSRTGAIPPAGDHVNFYATAAGSSEQVFLGQGDVTWNADGSAPAVGTASLTVSGWVAGQYTITADFVGDIFDVASTGQAVFGVTAEAPTKLRYNGDASQPLGTPASASFQLTSGGAPVAGEPVTITIDGQDYPGTTDASGNVAVPVRLPIGAYPVTASFTGDSRFLATSGDGTLAVTKLATTTTYTGDTQTAAGKTATLSATLVDANYQPLAGKAITLSFGSVSCTATTDATGTASCTVTVVDPPTTYSVTTSFAGDDTYLASSGPGSIVVTGKASPAITDNVSGNFLQGAAVTLGGTLTANGLPVSGKTVTLTLGTASCTGVTDTSGAASCQVAAPGPTGPTTTTASFAGDAAYLPAGDAKTALVYAYAPGGGSFVVGDQTATGSVTFWGSQWSKQNVLSAGDSKASDFKGFADTATPQCGGTWTASPGASSKAPAGPLPTYMAVIVASQDKKSGNTTSGNIVHFVIVKTNAGYKNDPGHAGTGTVVATIC